MDAGTTERYVSRIDRIVPADAQEVAGRNFVSN